MRPTSRPIPREMKILIVDPDEQARGELCRVLGAGAVAGELTISMVGSAQEALKQFKREHPDLILISTRDLGEVGGEVAAKVRATEGLRHTGIIFIDSRAKDDNELSVECLEMGADDFLRRGCAPEEVMARVRAVLRLKAMTDELRSANHKLQVLSMTDELTGLANMRSFNQSFGDILRRCRKGRMAIGVMMIDLDHFKSVNDSTNHLIGSFVIGETGRLMRQNAIFDEGDIAARYGGDEFIVACEAASLDVLYAKAEALRRVIGQHAFERDGCLVRITASVGVAWAAKGFNGRAEDLIKAADLMLYQSKHAGRNRASGMVLKYPLDLTVAATLVKDLKPAEEEEDDKPSRPRSVRNF